MNCSTIKEKVFPLLEVKGEIMSTARREGSKSFEKVTSLDHELCELF